MAVDPQTALDERTVDNVELVDALELRERAKQEASAARAAYRDADQRAKQMLAEWDVADGEVVRCGRFRITKRAVPSRDVAFSTSPTSRVTISLDAAYED